MDQSIRDFIGSGQFIAVLAVTGGLLIALVSIVTTCITSVSRSRERERTRRDIAAYVAEGTITPEQADRLLSGMHKQKKPEGGCCA